MGNSKLNFRSITQARAGLSYNLYRPRLVGTTPMRRFAIVFLSLFVELSSAQEPVSFHKQLKPILARQCLGCHQGASRQAELSLANVKDILAGGHKGPAVAAGAPEKSLLVSYLTGETKPQMPFGGKA